MNAGQVALLVAAVVAVVAVVVLAWVARSVTRALSELRDLTGELRNHSLPLVEEARVAIERAGAELEAVDRILTTTESISVRVESASKLAYLVFSNPVIKLVALGRGTTATLRHLRRRREV
ncbi:MAG: hypothetical protein ACRD0I_08645 [Acidimicrobiales bacterium]